MIRDRSDTTLMDTNRAFQKHCETGMMLFSQKNRQYDGAFRKYGLIGCVFELLGILERIPPMTIWLARRSDADIVKLKDLFLDLHNYACMALIVLEDNNWDGKHPIKEGETDAHNTRT